MILKIGMLLLVVQRTMSALNSYDVIGAFKNGNLFRIGNFAQEAAENG